MSELTDTHPDVHRRMVEGFRRMTPTQRLQRLEQLNKAAFNAAAMRIRRTYGQDISPRELRLREASLRLPRETMIKVFHWDPAEKGY